MAPNSTNPVRRKVRVHTLFNPPSTEVAPGMAAWRVRLHDVIFEADTRAGRFFDFILLWLIVISVVAVMLESIPGTDPRMVILLRGIEWTVTVLFTMEYVLRLASVRHPFGYATSFFGIVDLLSVIPTYISLFVAGAQALAVIRVLRVLRVFRLLRLSQFVQEAQALTNALMASMRRITVFLGSVLTLVVIMGAIMYVIEGPRGGFDSIPRGVYWAIVTLTTVGYGDISPTTPLGQAVAAGVMVLGYSIIAVPTGVLTVELTRALTQQSSKSCPKCNAAEPDPGAQFCRRCGARFADRKHPEAG